MANYFSLPLELRQKILLEAVSAADNEDVLSLLSLEKVLSDEPLRLIMVYGQVPAADGSNDRVLPLHYTPTVAKLIDDLMAVNGSIKADLIYVVNKWADGKKEVNRAWFVRESDGGYPCDDLVVSLTGWLLGLKSVDHDDGTADPSTELEYYAALRRCATRAKRDANQA